MCRGETVDILDEGCGTWSCQAGGKKRKKSFIDVVKQQKQKAGVIETP